jgi:hypothetical protein
VIIFRSGEDWLVPEVPLMGPNFWHSASECTGPSMPKKVVDTAGIVRDALFRQLKDIAGLRYSVRCAARCEMTLQSPIINESQEEAAIRKLEAALVEAWNRQDAKAFANLFTEDEDVVNVLGMVVTWALRDREEDRRFSCIHFPRKHSHQRRNPH